MHSADFAVARCPPVRLFVCHTPVNTAEHILIFYRHVAHLSSFFSVPNGMAIFRRERGRQMQGV